MVDTIVFEVIGEFSANWPSGRGKEVGCVYGSAWSFSRCLKQPLIFNHGHLLVFISLKSFGICMLHTEASSQGRLPKSLAEIPPHFLETESFYSIFVDNALATKSFPVDVLESILGENRIDLYQDG